MDNSRPKHTTRCDKLSESVLIFLERPIITGSTKAYERVKRVIDNKYLDWSVVEEAFDLKYDWEEKIGELNYWDKIVFCWKALSFVVVLGWLSVFTKIYISLINVLKKYSKKRFKFFPFEGKKHEPENWLNNKK
ncbi:MAG: hypothetical protein QMD36_01820 [Candidatus Aenigmarchaeota archaeon]|nr:hypothetical protein [Candidatus Aenigmarchaeota archaeon]